MMMDDDWKVAVTVALSIIVIVITVVLGRNILDYEDRFEGLVMNKIRSEGYSRCIEEKCEAEPTRWIVMVQNGERKEWWQVSETYFDSVNIGDWVRK